MIIGYEYEPFLYLKPSMDGHEIYIITRRRNRKEMLEILKKSSLNYHKLIHFDSPKEFDTHDVILHKKRAIYYYQLEKFYEDNEREYRDLKTLCPTTEVILTNFNNIKKDN